MIDAHVHVWRIGANGCTWPPASLTPIHRDFTLDDWRAEPGAEEVAGVVLVQSQEDAADTAWLLALAESDPAVLGVVGWADLEAPDAADAVRKLVLHPKLRGLRPMVQDREADWYDAPALEPVWCAMQTAGLVLDALIKPHHLAALARLASRYPALPIVIDHGAKPVLSDLTGWHHDLQMLAAHRQVRCKLSGLLTERMPGQPPAAIEPAAQILIELFAPDRLMWGSDWPVVTLGGSYQGWLQQARALVPTEHQGHVFGATARATYGVFA